MRKRIILTTLLVLTLSIVNAQDNTCTNNLDSTEVIQLLKKKKLIYVNKDLTEEEINNTPVYQPKVKFDSEKCIWNVSSTKYKSTRKGKCRKTNGCTIITTLHVAVNAKTKKIMSKYKEVKKVPNYE